MVDLSVEHINYIILYLFSFSKDLKRLEYKKILDIGSINLRYERWFYVFDLIIYNYRWYIIIILLCFKIVLISLFKIFNSTKIDKRLTPKLNKSKVSKLLFLSRIL